MSQTPQSNSEQNVPMQSLEAQAKSAFDRVNAACPEDAQTIGKYIGALRSKNVVALGEGEAFALTDAEGRQIRATKRSVLLTAENGGLCQPVWGGPYTISAPGYMMLAHASGAVVMNAPTVTVDGVQQQNPYVRRAPDGSIIEIHCRAMAFRYNENGQPMVSDRTTIFDTATYAMADMVGKAKKAKDAFKLLPSHMGPPTPPEQWACYRVDDAVNLWMCINHDEVISFLGQVLNRKKKAMEFAQTFAQRNALKHLFGIALVPGQTKNIQLNTWRVPVVCWSPSDGGFVRFDTARYAASTEIITALTEGKPVALPASHQPIVVSRGTEELHGADLDQELDPEENQSAYEQQEAPRAAAPPSATLATVETTVIPPEELPVPDQEWTADEMREWNNLQVAREEFPSEFEDAMKELGFDEADLTPHIASAVNRAISRVLDAE